MKKWNDNRAKCFDDLEWANDFDQMVVILQAMKIHEHSDILEVGCGTGKLTECIAGGNYQSFDAIDPSQEMIACAAGKNLKGVNYTLCKIEDYDGDIEAVTFSKYYDVIVMRNVLHHVDNIHVVLKKCYRMLKHWGRIVIAEGIPSAIGYHIFKEALLIKEDRHILTLGQWSDALDKVGFRQQTLHRGLFKEMSLNNLLDNDGTLSEDRKGMIMSLYREASKEVKISYNVKFVDDDMLCDFIYVIIQGERE